MTVLQYVELIDGRQILSVHKNIEEAITFFNSTKRFFGSDKIAVHKTAHGTRGHPMTTDATHAVFKMRGVVDG